MQLTPPPSTATPLTLEVAKALTNGAVEITFAVILDESEPGHGPRLHRHAYDETWVIQEGTITFQVGDEKFAAGRGDVAIIPAGAPHKFTNNGPGRSKIVCMHASPTIVGEWLE